MGVGKIIVGLLLIVIGIWALLPTAWCEAILKNSNMCPALWQELWNVVLGVVPAFLIFIGLILVWIEAEEMKVQAPRKKK